MFLSLSVRHKKGALESRAHHSFHRERIFILKIVGHGKYLKGVGDGLTHQTPHGILVPDGSFLGNTCESDGGGGGRGRHHCGIDGIEKCERCSTGSMSPSTDPLTDLSTGMYRLNGSSLHHKI